MSLSKDAKRGYLLWDEGFGVRFVLSLLGIASVLGAAASSPTVQQRAWEYYQEMLFSLMDGAHRLQWWGAIGLLSSSCCALQLLLNALNFGCAGFNNVLGPLRPTLCALTLCVQSAVWYTALNAPVPQFAYVAPCTVLAVALTLLPELTYFWVSRAVKAKAHTGLTTGVQSCLALAVEGMGCVSCTKKVAEVLDSFPEVLSREIIFEEKRVRATLSLGVEEARELLLPRLLASVAEAGFQAELAELSVPTGEKLSESPDALSASEGSPQASCCEAGLLSGAGVAGLPLSIAAGLAGSSCCLLQLGVNLLATLNIFHVGCAGFNKVLGPRRQQLRSLTFLWLLGSWGFHLWRRRGAADKQVSQVLQRSAGRRLLLRTALCLVLTFLPEVLLWSGGPGLAPDVQGAEVLKVKVDGMGCEACQAHVQGVMDRMGGVVSSRVNWVSGEAELVINRGWNFDMATLSERLEVDGYSILSGAAQPSKGPSNEL